LQFSCQQPKNRNSDCPTNNDCIKKNEMNGTGDHHAERDKPRWKGQITNVLLHSWNLDIERGGGG
jgi:hypothetical protein